MTEPESGGSAGRDALVTSQHRVGLVWLVPIVAVLVGAYLVYEAISSRGPTITIAFETAEGLTAGKTKLRYRNVDVGTVDSIAISEDLSHVVVTCSMDIADPHMNENTRVWVVRPRIGAGGISGLGTLVSGAYIALSPGGKGGKLTRHFTGLESPPVEPADAPGLKLVLHTNALRGLDVDSPVLHRQENVGAVERHKLAADGKSVEIDIYIQPEYRSLVGSNSRFWNASGVDVKVGIGGVNVQTESLAALLAGGIAFDTPGKSKPEALEHGAKFWLHGSRTDMEESAFRYGGLALVVEAPELGGLKVGDRVYYREEPVGAVVSHGLSADHSAVRVHLNIQTSYASLVRSNSVFWNASGISANLGLKGLHIHTESLEALLSGGIAFATPDSAGAQVKPGSVFRLHPEVKDDWLKWSGGEGAKKEEHEGALSRIFHHHEEKTEEAAAADHDPEKPRPAENPKQGFFHKLFRRDK
jgi:paraquat-inducible protein B